jgi:small GTP-binding protein
MENYKIITVGDANAGKSSLIYRYRYKSFHNTEATVGAAFNVAVIDNIKLQIWDTAGNERYKSLTPMYLRGSQLVLYCIDLSTPFNQEYHRNSINSIKNECSSEIFIVGTKNDAEIENYSSSVRKFAINLQLRFFSTSSKTGENIEELFNSAAEYLKTIKPFSRDGVTLVENKNQCCVIV